MVSCGWVTTDPVTGLLVWNACKQAEEDHYPSREMADLEDYETLLRSNLLIMEEWEWRSKQSQFRIVENGPVIVRNLGDMSNWFIWSQALVDCGNKSPPLPNIYQLWLKQNFC